MTDSEILVAIRTAVETAIPNAVVDVRGGAGHFTLAVTSAHFAGRGMLACHREVYAAIAHLMKGDHAPVHAIDSLQTRAS